MYENAGTRQPEPLHAGYVEDELCALAEFNTAWLVSNGVFQ